jgi:hypothetical protein
MKLRPVTFIICLLLITFTSAGQYYNTGQDPGSLRWLQIKTENFRLIFPESYGERGVDFARSLDNAYLKLLTRYPLKRLKIPVIIHNYTTGSNGYVAWAPSRMEIYPTPEQNSIPLDPNTQLAVHEMTHVMQMNSLNKGFTKAMSVLAGQQIPGLVSSLIPLWFLEGDAVFSESVLTNSGRGRSPSFLKQFKAIAVEKGKIYKYDKILNGSFRDFVPDHYHSGYQIAAFSYARYDSSLWKKAFSFTSNAPFLINTVNLSLRSNASLTKKKLYKEAFDTLKTIWSAEDSKSKSKKYETLNPPKKEIFVNYYSPVYAGNDTILAVRTSLTDPPFIVLIRPSLRTEKKIFTPGYVYPWTISFGGGKIAWVETHSDPRWENRTWSVIRIMDLKSRTVRQLSEKTRYMAVSVSRDGNYIAAVRNSIDNKNDLVIINSQNGAILKEIVSEKNAYLQRPQWDDTGRKLTVISLTEEGEGISSCNVADGTWNTIIAPSNNDLQSSFIRNDSLFFISSVSGTDNVYLRCPNGEIQLLTRSRFGAGDLDISGNSLLFTDYSADGNNICMSDLKASEEEMLTTESKSSFLINRFRSDPSHLETATDKTYTPVPYRKWLNLFRFHSWMPFHADIDEIKSDPLSIRPGFTLMTQNNLSTLVSTLGYKYDDNRHQFHSSVKWLGWYFVLESRFDYGSSPVVIKKSDTIPDPLNLNQGRSFTNTLSLPLSFNGNTFSQFLYISASSAYLNDHIYLTKKGGYDTGQNQLTGRIYFSNYYKSAVRDIYPRWAQYFDLSITGYPFDKDLYGNMVTAKTAFYFPGLISNNVIRLRFEAEKQKFVSSELGVSHFYNKARFPRSYNNIISKELTFLSADYYMPLAYPDFNLASLLYLKRIRASLFYDYARGTGNYILQNTDQGRRWIYNDGGETFTSFGVELLSDFYLLRIPYMITGGLQASWRETGEAPYLKLLLNIDIYGMTLGKRRI